jgi:beta-lactam-binding protein with PASTA domain
VTNENPPAGTALRSGSRVTLTVSSGPASAALPTVEGQEAAQAVAKLRRAGFKPVTRSQSDPSVAAGHVISTSPAAFTVAQLGSPVTVFVSSGPAPVKVPDVVGQSQSSAEATLTNAGLTVGAIAQRVSTQTPGTVIAQSPQRGGSVSSGSSVELVVAKASNEATVPNVVGQGEASAAAALGSAGFSPHASAVTVTKPAQVGVVLKQSPAGGRQAKKGSGVTIVVGQAGTPPPPTPTTTPTGTTPAAAPPTPAK